MKAVPLKDIKQALQTLSNTELQQLCQRLSRFKKENKELLTYILFESEYEDDYIQSIKTYMDDAFAAINTSSYFYIKKSVRKILREIKKFSRYSPHKETEVSLLLYFCHKLKQLKPSIKHNITLQNLYNRQLVLAKKIINTLHDDLQYDFNLMIETL